MRYVLLVVLAISSCGIYAQQGSFAFFSQSHSVHNTALGGKVVTSTQYVPSLYIENPSLAADSLSSEISLGFFHHPSGAVMGQASGSVELPKLGLVQITARRLGYGNIPGYDETGLYTGEFGASDNVLIIGKSLTSGNYSVGMNLKWGISNIAEYYSNALALDLGGHFKHPEKEWSAGLVIRNIGFIISDYAQNSDSSLPFEIRVGTTYKPIYMPFRFSLSIHGIDGRENFPLQGDLDTDSRKVLSFINIGTEVVWSENVQLLIGYNFRKRYELRLEDSAFGAGLAGGLRIRKNGFTFEYGFSREHVAGSINHLSVTVNAEKVLGLKKRTNE